MNKKINKKEIIPVFFATDDNYVPFVHVSILSLLENGSKNYNYNIHILTEGLTQENIDGLVNTYSNDCVKIIINNLTEKVKKHKNNMYSRFYYSNAIYYRAYIPEMFPEYNRAIYLDCDIAVNGDISELYNMDLKNNFIAGAVCEVVRKNKIFSKYSRKFLGINTDDYINSGVLLMDCEVLRKIKFEENFFSLLNNLHVELCPDQDFINIICNGRILILNEAWNVECIKENKLDENEVKIAHYNINQKPWLYDDIPYAGIFWKYAKRTLDYKKILAKKEQFNEDKKLQAKKRMEDMLKLAETTYKQASRTILDRINNYINRASLNTPAVTDSKYNVDIKSLKTALNFLNQKFAN